MRVSEAFHSWLKGPRRPYGEGLRLFSLLADRTMKKRWLSFLEKDSDAPSVMQQNLLLDKMRRLESVIQRPSQELGLVLDSEFQTENAAQPQNAPVIPKAAAPAVPSSTFTEGSKITPDRLPKEQRQMYEEIRAIVPLEARLHSDLSSAQTDDDRKRIAREICDLDDRRRHLWDLLDSWQKSSNTDLQIPKPEYSDSGIVKGLEMARRIKRLKDNIRSSKLSIARFEKHSNFKSRDVAKARLEEYQKELDDLEKMIADEEGKGQL